ncbi:hypothetical protein EDC23_0200 [Thiohalophilus thiocyanatoxydans]|uniref:Uncharacterized protein n=1 Tax=Thiohalophilus thiocyanatoxydans TaxID=381308 RepID=A0A4R8J0Y2_9GAMM|nr:hypothetical protein EDC23_0200 [Thiohalophilus thiocyanatoxydans]
MPPLDSRHRDVPSGEPDWSEKRKEPVQPLEMAEPAASSGAFPLVRFVVALQRNEPEARWRVSAFKIQGARRAIIQEVGLDHPTLTLPLEGRE